MLYHIDEMADLRKILDVKNLKAPTRPLKELLRESTAQAKDDIVTAGRSTDVAAPPAAHPAH